MQSVTHLGASDGSTHLEGAQVVHGQGAVAAAGQQRALRRVRRHVGDVVRVLREAADCLRLPQVPQLYPAIVIACAFEARA